MYGHYKRFIFTVKVFSITMDSLSIGIRADDVGHSRIILREGNYRVWSTVLEQTLREKKLWNHVMGTSVPPPAPRTCAPRIAAVAADPTLMIAAMAGVAEITQEQVDLWGLWGLYGDWIRLRKSGTSCGVRNGLKADRWN